MSELPSPREVGAVLRYTAPAWAIKMDAAFTVETLEGTMTGAAGDYLVAGAWGDAWPVRADIFEATYVPLVPPASLRPVDVARDPHLALALLQIDAGVCPNLAALEAAFTWTNAPQLLETLLRDKYVEDREGILRPTPAGWVALDMLSAAPTPD